MDKHNQNNLTVVKHNHLNQASYKLSLDERRLILSAISMVNPQENIPEEITIFASDFAHQWNINPKYAYDQLKEARQNLFERSLRVQKQENGEVWDIRWVSSVAYKDGEGYIKLSFTKNVAPYLSNLKKHFTSYHLAEVRSFKSGHAIRLYELLMQFRDTGWFDVSVKKLKAMFGVEDNYPEWYEFKRRVINVSVKEINDVTNYKVKYEIKRKGRKVVGLMFSITLREQPDMFK